MSRSEEGDGEEACPIRGSDCGGQGLQVEVCSMYVRMKLSCVGSWKNSNGMGVIKLFCYIWLSPLFKHVQNGFPGFDLSQAISSVHVVWVHFQFNAFRDDSVHISEFCLKTFCVI
jgi:hypothetical protein